MLKSHQLHLSVLNVIVMSSCVNWLHVCQDLSPRTASDH